MKTIIAATILVSACATTGRSLPVESTNGGVGPEFDGRVAASDDMKAWFPTLASDAVLPSVAHYQKELSTDRDRYELTARVCVAPTGEVTKVEITQSSTSAELDRAATQDIANWKFEPFSAPQNIRVCKQLAFAYEPHAELSALHIPLVRLSHQ